MSLNDSEKEKIRVSTRELLKKFSASLQKVKMKSKVEKNEVGGFREEGNGVMGDPGFRKMMFDNAQEKTDECIIAERKKW